jgi:hypothetical protein
MILCLWYNIASEIEREEGKKKCWRKTSLFFHHGNFFFFRFPAAVSSKIKRGKKEVFTLSLYLRVSFVSSTTNSFPIHN